MKITLNPHGLLAKLYRAFYNETKLPNNLCNYFWKLILAIILSPLLWPMLLINGVTYPIERDEDNKYYGGYMRSSNLYGALINGLMFIFGVLATEKYYGRGFVNYIHPFKMYLNGIVVSVIALSGITVIIGFIYLCSVVFNYFDEKKEKEKYNYEEETEAEYLKRKEQEIALMEERELKKQKSLWYLSKKMFFAWKEKNCPLIEWK